MRIEKNGATFDIRGLRLSEISGIKMRRLGYGRFVFRPQIPEGDDTEKYLSDCQDAALTAVLTPEQYELADQVGGARFLSKLWREILTETYGRRDDEKNSLSAGSGKSTPSESITATPAENTGEVDAETAATDSLPALTTEV